MAEDKKAEKVETQVDVQKEDKTKDKPKVKLSQRGKEIFERVKEMPVLELVELIKCMEEEFGVSAALPVMTTQVGPGAQAQAGAAPQEEKTMFNVELSKVGANKIQVIKEIRAITNLGLKEAKDLVEAAPKLIKEGASKEEAEDIKKKLTAVGATVELK